MKVDQAILVVALLGICRQEALAFKTAPTISAAPNANTRNRHPIPNHYDFQQHQHSPYLVPIPEHISRHLPRLPPANNRSPASPPGSNARGSPSSSSSSLPFAYHPNFQAFCRGETDITVIPNAFEQNFIQDLKWDAFSMKQEGFGEQAGVAAGNGNKKRQNIRRNVHQIWLSSLQSRPMPSQSGVRNALLQRTNELARTIQMQAQSPSSPYSRLNPNLPPELSYLFYEPGSFYQKHVDKIPTHNPQPVERQVSFILYLGHENDDMHPYNMERDGGALRVYKPDQSSFAFDVPPTANTLVIFNSAKVPHAVMETHRSRFCIVGWLHGNTNNQHPRHRHHPHPYHHHHQIRYHPQHHHRPQQQSIRMDPRWRPTQDY